MTQELKDKISKVYELVNNGGTDGEKAAAKLALNRIMKKYNIDESELANIGYSQYFFSYKTVLDIALFNRLITVFTNLSTDHVGSTNWHNGKPCKKIFIIMYYVDWIAIECSYEYFRRHMANQWKITCADVLNRCKKAKTKAAKRQELLKPFLTEYFIKSNLFKDGELVKKAVTSQKKANARMMMNNVEGGKYNKQVVTNLAIENV